VPGVGISPKATGPITDLFDVSFLGVVLGNAVAIVLALLQGWNIDELMWVYWGQSVVIGITNVVRMLSLTEFTTKGMTMNDRPVPETAAAKIQVATFFALHYGFFHLIYAIFLWQQMALNTLLARDRIVLAFCVGAFVISHVFSLRHNRGSDFREKKPNLGTLMFYPYLRIIPMHLAIIFGSLLGDARLLLFMGLKTFADAGMHLVEHRIFRGGVSGVADAEYTED